MLDQAELLPCPFCGAADGRIEQSFTRATDDFSFWSVECLDCGVAVSDDESQDAADRAWNTRATPKSSEGALLDEAVEVLKQASTAINAAHQQTDAEWRDHIRAADRHDKTVRAFREQVRAFLVKAGKAQS